MASARSAKKRLLWSMLAVMVVSAAAFSAASASVAAPSKKSAKPKLTTVTMAIPPGALQETIVVLAQQRGFFARHGLNVDFTYVIGGPAIVAAVLSHSVDIGDTVPVVSWPLLQQGQSIVGLIANQAQTYNIIAQPDLSGVTDAAPGEPAALSNLRALKGKTIGVSARGSANETVARRLLLDAGLNPDSDVTFVAIGNTTTGVPAFLNHQVDAMVTFPPEEALLGRSNFKYAAHVAGTGVFKELLTDYWGTTPSWLTSHAAVAQNFCKGIADAYVYAENPAHANVIARFIQLYLALPTSAMARSLWKQYSPTFTIQLSAQRWSQQKLYFSGTPTDGFMPPYNTSVYAPCQKIANAALKSAKP
jgi:NitT/TauT family transport system substrate-binding protein